jgi:hypothetical protein
MVSRVAPYRHQIPLGSDDDFTVTSMDDLTARFLGLKPDDMLLGLLPAYLLWWEHRG